jgi:hypothetical protein
MEQAAGQDKKQICTMDIVFNSISDEQAIDIKKKIETILADIPTAKIRFSLIPSTNLLNRAV